MSEKPNCFGVDYDGTIADTNFMKTKWIHENLGREIYPWQGDRTSCVPIIGAANYETMADVVYEREWSLQAPPVAGALDALRVLSGRGKVYVVTARLPHRLAFAKEWLGVQQVAGFVNGFLCSARIDKGKLCKDYGIDILIDDDVRHLRHMSQQHIRAILLKPGFKGELRLPVGLEFCRSWNDVLTKL